MDGDTEKGEAGLRSRRQEARNGSGRNECEVGVRKGRHLLMRLVTVRVFKRELSAHLSFFLFFAFYRPCLASSSL